MLEYILNSSIRVKILQLMVRRQDWLFSESEISRELKEPKTTVHRQIKLLRDYNLLLNYKKGNNTVYRLNEKNYIVKKMLEPLFLEEDKAVIELSKEFCNKVAKSNLCILFGSAPKGQMKPTSDADIAIISKNRLDKASIEKCKQHFLENFGLIFSVHTFQQKEFKKRYDKRDPYILEIVNGKILTGDIDEVL